MRNYLLSIFIFSIFISSVNAQMNPAAIDIVRDHFGVPHIFGKTDPDVAYGLAWAHAEDDFFTIQQSLMAGKGMMARYKGKKGATVDYIIHLMRIKELVEEKYNTDLGSDFKKLLEGYCAGLNAFAKNHPKEVLLKKLFPVTPKDMIQYSVLQLCVLSGADKALTSILKGSIPLPENFKATGSNAFALNSKKTIDGEVYLDINAHQPLEGAAAFYEAHLCSEEGWNILGANFPGAPCILHGCNQNLGWAHTVNAPDKIDVYQLQINPSNPMQYKYDGNWKTLEEDKAYLKVKIKGFIIGVHKKIYQSIYGPTVITPIGTYSIRMPAQMDIRGLEEWYRFNKAKNFTEFKQALNMLAIPGYNIVYADRFDTIFYISNARLPIRDPTYNWKATLPGNTSATLWTSLHPVSDLPQVLEPASGFVFNTNHSPFHSTEGPENPMNRDITMGYETNENNRSLRFSEMLSAYPKISFDNFKKIKFDRQYPVKLAFPINCDTLFLLNPKEYPEIADLIHNLVTWDKIGDAESIGAGTFLKVYEKVSAANSAYPKAGMLNKEQCVAVLTDIKAEMLKDFGRTNLQLGEIQKIVRGDKELPLPGLPDVLAAMYSIPYKNGMVKGYSGDAYIELVRFTKNGPIIESVNAYGASSHKDSPHYTDQMELYIHQQTKPMTLDKATIYQQAERIYHPG